MKYPLCARAKLHVFKIPLPDADLVSAADVEKLLEGAPVVYGVGAQQVWSKDKDYNPYCACTFKDATHTARLLLIEEIAPKTCPTCGGKIENHKD